MVAARDPIGWMRRRDAGCAARMPVATAMPDKQTNARRIKRLAVVWDLGRKGTTVAVGLITNAGGF